MTADGHERAPARADLCRFLAACYYEPGPEFSEERLFQSMLAAAERAAPDLSATARRLGEAYSASPGEELLVDYTRLFLGPARAIASPYGSSWLEGEAALMQATSAAVAGLYEAGGFEVDDAFRDLPDHVAVELEFLYLLLFREAQSRTADDGAGLAAVAQLRARFLDEHLARWVGPFTAAIESGATTAFYRELAVLTRRFIEAESLRDRP
jgi:TorA maturation chaperone TorD